MGGGEPLMKMMPINPMMPDVSITKPS
jgi:hypothetical protein